MQILLPDLRQILETRAPPRLGFGENMTHADLLDTVSDDVALAMLEANELMVALGITGNENLVHIVRALVAAYSRGVDAGGAIAMQEIHDFFHAPERTH